MTALAWAGGVIGALLVAGYIALRLNRRWIYRWFDRALDNPRDHVPPDYELPRYVTVDDQGRVDTGARWPGWDGWYFFVLPEGGPVKMLRASLMTGLYGLDGVDSYQRLGRLGPYQAAEHLSLVAAEGAGGQPVTQRRQVYLPRVCDLTLARDRLEVELRDRSGAGQGGDHGGRFYGRVQGAWPSYTLEVADPDTGMRATLAYRGQELVWWADVPGVFTYFAAFGRIEGTMRVPATLTSSGRAEDIPIRGRGCFEHGCARKPFGFDALYAPVRAIQRLVPGFRPIRYHYELFIDDSDLRGGFMRATGFGITARDRGGLYMDGDYLAIHRVAIEYVDDPPPERGEGPGAGPSAARFYRRWRVRASTDRGLLEYEATREWPAQPITANMMYYYFTYRGSLAGQPIAGSGYGEYLHI